MLLCAKTARTDERTNERTIFQYVDLTAPNVAAGKNYSRIRPRAGADRTSVRALSLASPTCNAIKYTASDSSSAPPPSPSFLHSLRS